MSPKDDDWRLPALKEFGEQLQRAESAAHARESVLAHGPSRWRRRSVRAVALLGTVALLAAALDVVTPAGASSPINHAPAAAAQSKSVRFSSALQVTINGHALARLTEVGAVDFATGDYTTTLDLKGGSKRIERQRLGDTLYVQQHRGGGQDGRAYAIHLAKLGLAPSTWPRGYTLIDPQVVFRVLAGARSPVAVVGHGNLDGTQTTHYRLSTNLSAFLAAEGGAPDVRGSYESTGATLDVWLDGHGRPRRVSVSFTGSSRFGDATLTAAINFSRYGAPVLVRAPPTVGPSVSEAGIPPSLSADPIRLLERLFFSRR